MTVKKRLNKKIGRILTRFRNFCLPLRPIVNNKKPMNPLTYEQALGRAAALCSRSEQCAHDIREKCRRWGLSDGDIARLITCLEQEKFLCEQRYVHAFVNDKYRYQHWGRTKIAYALRLKGIDGSAVAEALNEVAADEEYQDTLVELIRSRLKNATFPLSQQDRARIYRFAMQRGYESAVIGKALRQVCSDGGIDDDDL